MSNTPDLNIPFPDEYQDPFFVDYTDQMNDLESWLKISWEEGQLLVYGGGTISFSSPNVTWSSDIIIESPMTGNKVTITADTQQIDDNEILWATGLTRPLANATITTFGRGATGPGWDSTKFPLFKRVGSNIYLIRHSIGLERLTLRTP